jgi:hypothetical protein
MITARPAMLALIIALNGWACSAQEVSSALDIPSETSARIGPTAAVDDAAYHSTVGFHFGTASTSVTFVPPVPAIRHAQTADSKFFLLNGVQLGMSILDVELTQRCISSRHCRELNPAMPSSQAGKLSVNFVLVAADAGISYWLKKRGTSLWWLPPAAGTAVHSAGVATGLEHQ